MKCTIKAGLWITPLMIALFGWIMSRPLSHDEQLFVSSGAMMQDHTLYKDLIYNHLPNFPLLLSAIYSSTHTTHYLLAARFTVFVSWIFSLALLHLIAIRWTQSRFFALAAVLLLLTNELFLNGPGTYATNSFIPVPFSLLGILLLFEALDTNTKASRFLFFSGIAFSIAIGMKANYVFVVIPVVMALLVSPRNVGLGQRLTNRLLPFALGGLVGGAPALYAALSNWDIFWYSVYESMTGPHLKYFMQNYPDNPTLTFSGKLQYAGALWHQGTSLLLLAALFGSIMARLIYSGKLGLMEILGHPKPVILASICLLGLVISFVPTPSFEQYFTPPIIFIVLFVLAMVSTANNNERRAQSLLLATVVTLSLLIDLNTYVEGFKSAFNTDTWTGLNAHKAGRKIREFVCRPSSADAQCNAFVATLAPIFALEAGLKEYPELSAGPFGYRIADYLVPKRFSQLKLTSINTIDGFLALKMPEAMLVGFEGALDEPLIKFAHENNYREEKFMFEWQPRYIYMRTKEN